MNSSELFERAVNIASKEFVRGFIIGQVALLLLLIFLARLLLFRGGGPTGTIASIKQISFPTAPRARWREAGLETSRETCTWLNVLISSTILTELRRRLGKETVLLQSLSNYLSSSIPSNELGPLTLTKLQLGELDPRIEWIRHSIVAGESTLWIALNWEQIVAEIDVETAFTIYWPPKNPVASLPCALTFALRSLHVILQLKLPSHSSDSNDGHQTIELMALKDEFQLDVEIHSLVGHRSKLKDIPKLTTLLQEQLRKTLIEKFLEPRNFVFPSSNWWGDHLFPKPSADVLFSDMKSKDVL